MNNKVIYKIGDKVQTQDGRIGVIISIDRDPIHQGPDLSQLIIVKFEDQLTQIGNAEEFKAVSEKLSSTGQS